MYLYVYLIFGRNKLFLTKRFKIKFIKVQVTHDFKLSL